MDITQTSISGAGGAALTKESILAALDEAERMVGGTTALAQRIRYTQPAISNARRLGRVSAEMAIRIEHATAGAVTKDRLNPIFMNSPAEASLPLQPPLPLPASIAGT